MTRVKGVLDFRKKTHIHSGLNFINPQRQAVKHLLESSGMSNREFKKANKKLMVAVGKKYVYKDGIMVLK